MNCKIQQKETFQLIGKEIRVTIENEENKRFLLFGKKATAMALRISLSLQLVLLMSMRLA
ncbi:hypothetical protein GXP75_19820 [Bacillus sp. HU-1818]|uniref:hypothetical protein n=1 Tax=Bacillus sp. HU-1818 TaxID=2704469 RepID=UPI001BEC7AF2|nr:hypothetical protein [Bacillus sp. HU-1818]MBT2626624.1 hypothetical protein [Bacillus sp. ISL-32]MCI3197868.1 hypothetical protein [Bacillus sp. HU-1818]